MTKESVKATAAAAAAASLSAWSQRQFWKPADFGAWTREVEAMATTPPAAVLSRLKEIAAAAASPATAADERSQLELERTRWMLSTLHHLDAAASKEVTRQQPGHRIAPDKVYNILALYESKATASYLAGLFPNKRICAAWRRT